MLLVNVTVNLNLSPQGKYIEIKNTLVETLSDILCYRTSGIITEEFLTTVPFLSL